MQELVGSAGLFALHPLARIAAEVAAEWGVELGPPFALCRYSYVAPAGADAVLKVTPPEDGEADEEANALALWDGDGAVRLLRHDRERRALLIERARPGDDISHLPEEEATAIAVELGGRLWRPAAEPFRWIGEHVPRRLDQAEPSGSDAQVGRDSQGVSPSRRAGGASPARSSLTGRRDRLQPVSGVGATGSVVESVSMPLELAHLGLDASAPLLPKLAEFYGGHLGLPLSETDSGIGLGIGESTLSFRASDGAPFYHVALLVPGDRFDAALAWAGESFELLPDRETGEVVFDFTNWDALAVYFHDPAGSIVELITHRAIGETGATGAFAARELLGISEIGLACDPPAVAAELERELGLELWDGTVEGEARLAFVGEKARTLILCRSGRPWLPTGRPAEAHPVEVVLVGARDGTVPVDPVGRVSVKAS